MADPIVEKTMFDRHFDGMAGESDMPRKLVARLCWLKRAEIAERHERELVEALRLCYDHCRLYHPEVERNNVGIAVQAALANHSNEVTA